MESGGGGSPPAARLGPSAPEDTLNLCRTLVLILWSGQTSES